MRRLLRRAATTPGEGSSLLLHARVQGPVLLQLVTQIVHSNGSDILVVVHGLCSARADSVQHVCVPATTPCRRTCSSTVRKSTAPAAMLLGFW